MPHLPRDHVGDLRFGLGSRDGRDPLGLGRRSLEVAHRQPLGDVRYFTGDDWRTATRAAGVRAPSDTTRRQVVAALELREAPHGDPFAGLDAA
jgi:hypothetical protein